MHGKNYYTTTLGEWRRKAHLFTSSHFVQVRLSGVTHATPEGAEARRHRRFWCWWRVTRACTTNCRTTRRGNRCHIRWATVQFRGVW